MGWGGAVTKCCENDKKSGNKETFHEHHKYHQISPPFYPSCRAFQQHFHQFLFSLSRHVQRRAPLPVCDVHCNTCVQQLLQAVAGVCECRCMEQGAVVVVQDLPEIIGRKGRKKSCTTESENHQDRLRGSKLVPVHSIGSSISLDWSCGGPVSFWSLYFTLGRQQ